MASPTVTGAMITVFDASPAFAVVQVNGGLWLGELPASKTFPWAILWHLEEIPDWNLGTAYSETTRFLFELYDTSVAGVEALAALVKNAFDPYQDSMGNTRQPSLSVTGATSYEVTRKRYNLVPASNTYRTADNKRVMQANLEYDVKVVKELRTGP